MSSADSMEEGLVDQGDVEVGLRDHSKSLEQNLKGQKVLATPAVRRVALENAVSNISKGALLVNFTKIFKDCFKVY